MNMIAGSRVTLEYENPQRKIYCEPHLNRTHRLFYKTFELIWHYLLSWTKNLATNTPRSTRNYKLLLPHAQNHQRSSHSGV